MSDEDPYAVSSDSENEDAKRKPPPKINIEGRSDKDFQQIVSFFLYFLLTWLDFQKQSLTSDQKGSVKDDKTLEEIEELRKASAQSMAQKKKDFEAGKSSLQQEGVEKALEGEIIIQFVIIECLGVGKENMSSMKQKFESQPEAAEFSSEQREEIGSLKRSEADRKKILAAFMEVRYYR
jgi:hypothetical protein